MKFFKRKSPPDLPFDAVSVLPPDGRLLALSFTAKTGDYFSLWVVCQLFTILTLGIYSPWARRRRLIFLSNHWLLDGERFHVELVPLRLLYGRLFAFAMLFLSAISAWFNPWLAPLIIALAFAPLPWLMSHSFAFRWRTMTYRGIRFNADVAPRQLWFPVWILGATLALATVPNHFWRNLFGEGTWQHASLVSLVALLVIPPLIFWPRVTAWLMHQKFKLARFGQTVFELDASPSQIYKHMNKSWIRSWIFIWMLIAIPIMVYFAIVKNSIDRDLQAVITSFCMLTISVAGVTMARGRRLNFVFHRLSVGGLRFTTTLNPNHAAGLTTGYAILAFLTLGLSIPWSTVHYNRWRAKHVQFYLQGDWGQFEADSNVPKAGGILDELANSFDIELGI